MMEVRHVDHYAVASGVSRGVAERDVVLTYILKMMKEDGVLGRLAFKGGTCIRKIYLGKTGRFSEDLDFTLPGGDLKGLDEAFGAFIAGGVRYGFSLSAANFRRDWDKSYACDINYKHEWNSGSIKFEVSLREEPILNVENRLPFNDMYFKYTGFKVFEIPCMKLEEVLSEKIMAAYMRTTTRDVFDLYQFAEKAYNRDAVKKLAVIKLWNEKHEYDPASLLEKIEKSRIDFGDIEYLLKDSSHPSEKEIKKVIETNYAYLQELDGDTVKIIGDVRKHKEEKLVQKLKRSLIDELR